MKIVPSAVFLLWAIAGSILAQAQDPGAAQVNVEGEIEQAVVIPEEQKKEEEPVLCDCTETVQNAVGVMQAEKTALQHEVTAQNEELQALLKLKNDLTTYVATLEQDVQQHQTDLQEITTQQSQAQEGQTAAEQLVRQTRLEVAQLQVQLRRARAEIQELSDVSFVKVLNKEIKQLLHQIVNVFK